MGRITFVCFLLMATFSAAQDLVLPKSPVHILFPYPMLQRKWQFSVGLALINSPRELTEEVRIRAPAGDVHMLRNIRGQFYLAGNVKFQIVQNHISAGIRWAVPVNDRFSFSLGNDYAWWFGFLNISDFDSRGVGSFDYPNLSIGYKIDNEILLTVKGELLLNLYTNLTNGGIEIVQHNSLYAGQSLTVALEQPFFKGKHVMLAVSAIYANYYWQTWALYNTFDRNIFYPQFTIGFVLCDYHSCYLLF